MCRGLGFGFLKGGEEGGGEENGAVAVGFEVDAAVEFGCGMVQVFDAGGSADNGEVERFVNVGCGGSVCIGGLDDPDAEVFKSGSFGEIADE